MLPRVRDNATKRGGLGGLGLLRINAIPKPAGVKCRARASII